ncbi:MAG TPA: NUDIX domain-containing protein, partial [Solirubrobacteraceae bacterium]|nr:NUDIX domain-containing protein [Solirubrobacteraceae bacterium]
MTPRRSSATSTEVSAGGVVLRPGAAGAPEAVVIVPTRRAADGRKVLALPKGHVDPGETPEQAAQREVREEAGVDATLVGQLGEVRYWYQRDGQVVVIVPTRRAANGQKVLALPKGHVDPGETAPQAAQREVREEAGVE